MSIIYTQSNNLPNVDVLEATVGCLVVGPTVGCLVVGPTVGWLVVGPTVGLVVARGVATGVALTVGKVWNVVVQLTWLGKSQATMSSLNKVPGAQTMRAE